MTITISSTNLEDIKEKIIAIFENIKVIKNNQKIEYYNVASAFDIEASSFYDNFIVKPENKRAIMYAWVFSLPNLNIIGRTWEEFKDLMDLIIELLNLNEKRRIVIYVHNLSYDFQFFRNHFFFDSVFALDKRDPIYAITNDGLEFRCSYKLSGYSLEKVGEHLTSHNVKKMVGDLDYEKIRTPETPLTEKELNYIIHDGEVVVAYIEEEIEANGNITKIPLTKTGKVRRYCMNACLHTYKDHKKPDNKYKSYRRLISRLKLNSVLEYKQLHQTFAGGFTHGNHLHINEVENNVASFDFTSSYPYVMISEQYPMFTGELIHVKGKEDFKRNLDLYCCMFLATFTEIDETFTYEHYISASKCLIMENAVQDNGRIVKADKISIMLTEQDFFIIEKTYKWKTLSVKNFRRYKRGYLPTDFVLSIINLYETKTKLKDVEEQVIEYQNAKENINSCYGMTVTDICRDKIIYSNDENLEEQWTNEAPDYEKIITKYNNDKRRFLFYGWGIWVTAYARANLWKAILSVGKDYRYSDTDSIKLVNLDAHKDFFIKYNKLVESKLKRVLELHKIDFNKVKPLTIKGKEKLIGVFDYEGTYKRFKYLGAKRYLCEKESGQLLLTVSGLNKKVVVPYLLDKYKTNDKIFEEFKEGLFIPKGYTGKAIHTYIDSAISGEVRDYLGNIYHYEELSAVHMEQSEYKLDLSAEFLRYLLGNKLIIE